MKTTTIKVELDTVLTGHLTVTDDKWAQHLFDALDEYAKNHGLPRPTKTPGPACSDPEDDQQDPWLERAEEEEEEEY